MVAVERPVRRLVKNLFEELRLKLGIFKVECQKREEKRNKSDVGKGKWEEINH